MFRSSIRRGPDDTVRLDLAEEERGLLRQVAEELRELLREEPETRRSGASSRPPTTIPPGSVTTASHATSS